MSQHATYDARRWSSEGRGLALIVADEPHLAHAVTLTMNSPDPDVELLRGQIAEWAMAHHEEINANRTTHI
jgi:hypothetical protein